MLSSCLTVRVRTGIEQLRQLSQCQRREHAKVRVRARVSVRVRKFLSDDLRVRVRVRVRREDFNVSDPGIGLI